MRTTVLLLSYVCSFVTCVPAICGEQVFYQRLSLSTCVCLSLQKLLIRNWCYLLRVCYG